MVNPLRPFERQELATPRQTDPFGLMRLRDQMDRLFENTLRDFGLPTLVPGFAEVEFRPSINVKERDDSIEITCDVPGIPPENIDVAIEENQLKIRGQRDEERVDENERLYVCERAWGEFERTVTLPEGVDRDNIEASYDTGVLSIHVPKTEQAQRAQKKIQVRTAQPQMTGGQPVGTSNPSGQKQQQQQQQGKQRS